MSGEKLQICKKEKTNDVKRKRHDVNSTIWNKFQVDPGVYHYDGRWCIFYFTKSIADFQLFQVVINITANGSHTVARAHNIFFGWMIPEVDIQFDEEKMDVAVNISQTYIGKSWRLEVLHSWWNKVIMSSGNCRFKLSSNARTY